VHQAQQGMAIAVLGEHGVVGYDFSGLGIGPFIPDASQSPRLSIRSGKSPPDVLAGSPVGFAIANRDLAGNASSRIAADRHCSCHRHPAAQLSSNS